MIQITSLKAIFTIACSAVILSCSKKEADSTPTPSTSNILKGTISTDKVLVNGAATVDYYLEEIVEVEAKLTIEPGTVIVAKAGSGISFSTPKGVVIAAGTALKPIVFKSESGAKGGWLGVKFQGSNNPLNQLSYVTITDGGSTSFDGDESKKANIQFAGVNQMKMDHCIVANSANWGIYETYSSDLTLIDFDSNQFKSNTNYPLFLFDHTAKDLGSSSVFSDNTKNYIALRQKNFDGLPGAHTWKKQAVPYYWDGTDNLVIGYYNTNGNLTLEAGAQLVMGPGTGIVVGDNANSTGFLKLMGTSTSNVLIKGESAVKGFWKGIFIRTNSVGNDFLFAKISDAGSTNLSGTGSKANVVVDGDAMLKMTNVFLGNSAGCGYTKNTGATIPGAVTGINLTYATNTGGNVCTY